MQYFKILLILLLTSSCQYFETEKISTETFYNEELKAIDWKDVDQYPTFSNCEKLTEKATQKACFENTLSAHLGQAFTKNNFKAIRELNDTIKLSLSIDNKGKLSITNISITPLIRSEFPLVESWIIKGIDTLQPVAPAYKRGIPVATKFTLPIILKTN